MKRCYRPELVALLLLLSACSSAPPAAPTMVIHPLEQNAMNAVANQLGEHARTNFAAALAYYDSVDDLQGQWRVRYQQILLDMKSGDRAAATVNLTALQDLAQLINSDAVHYATLLQSGRVLQEDAYYERAADYARTDIQRAVVRAYLGEVDTAIALIGNATPADAADRAFVLYRYAQENESAATYLAALDAYRLAGDSRGIADTLVSLARLESDNGNADMARTYARRAVRSLSASGDAQRAGVIRSWIKTL